MATIGDDDASASPEDDIDEDVDQEDGPVRQDVMAQQIKFIACLKVSLNSLSQIKAYYAKTNCIM